MRKKIGRYLMAAILCFSCILLFKSGNIEADDARRVYEPGLETGCDEEFGRDEDEGGGWRMLKFYLGGGAYIMVDLVMLVVVLVFVMVMVLGRVCGE